WQGPQVIAGLPDAAVSHVPCKALPPSGQFGPVVQDSPAHRLPHSAAIAGFLASQDDWDGVICLVSTQVHWVHVSAGEIVSFLSSVTPETFAVFASGAMSTAAFDEGLAQAMDRPERILSHIASARVAGGDAVSRILGLLIGADLKGSRAYWLGQRVAVIGDGVIADGYTRALTAQSVPVLQMPDTTLAGLVAAYKGLSQ
ncbi:MAG: 2-dehydro-3-deoxygalactonokinase, partial [Marivivens sp.]|nr:2-dehydro-3-deoxygalactonokinase [Marivivens sp.]